MAALLERYEPEDTALDGGAAGEQAVVLQDDGALGAEGRGDTLALLAAEDNAAEGIVDDMVVVEGDSVLGGDVERYSKGGERAAVDGMGVGDAVYLGAGSVDGMVDHVSWVVVSVPDGCVPGRGFMPDCWRASRTGSVEQLDRAALDDLSLVVDSDEVECFQEGPRHAKGIQPEGVGLDGVL